ncbi:hypothetical protein [Kineosporia babensis]|uniref:Carboxypeptidase regulatory-like domain-containing protein n=1 Tax=Kineosporia babensis TaxID=499548 RepID=A0A9X1N8G9_9ACTN|nr:hypothetical protein [Kineosporia babensis]MCD5310442.1 hypothetical protein [Kineosporia babensis]
MDVSLLNDEIRLEPDVPTELLVDVVNTADVIDVVQLDLTGAPGATSHLESTPTLFPGERRRLPLRVRLPAQMPAGRHELAVRVRPTATDKSREAALTVDVDPKPAMVVGVHPSVRKAGRRTVFPLTVANRGNTPLLVQPRLVEVPDGVGVSFEPNEFTLQPWQTGRSLIRVRGPRNLVGAALEHPLDLRVTAFSVTPGQPLLQQELNRDLQLTYRQKARYSTWLLFSIGLVVMLTIWCVLAYLGMKRFVEASAVPLKLAPGLAGQGRLDEEVPRDVSITISGTVLSKFDGSPVAGVTVLACDAEDPQLRPRRNALSGRAFRPRCERGGQKLDRHSREVDRSGKAVEQDVSAADGTWWIENISPGKYWLTFDSPHARDLQTPSYWYTYSCTLAQQVPSRPGEYRLAVRTSEDLVGERVRVVATPSTKTTSTPVPTATEAVETDPQCPDAREPLDETPAAPTPSAVPGNQREQMTSHLETSSRRAVLVALPPADGNPGPLPEGTGRPVTERPRDGAQDEALAEPDLTGAATATLHLKGLQVPGRYDLTIQVGGRTMLVRDVPVQPGKNRGVTTYRFSPADDEAVR